MKRLCIFIMLLISAVSLNAQEKNTKDINIFNGDFFWTIHAFKSGFGDFINIKNGESINCKIDSISLDYKKLYFRIKKGVPDNYLGSTYYRYSFSYNISDVASYIWDGEVNKGYHSPAAKISGITEEDILEMKLSPGNDLIKAGNYFLTSVGLSLGATLVSVAGNYFVKTTEGRGTIFIISTGIGFAAFGFQIAAWLKIRESGKKLNISPASNGIGLLFKIN